MLLVALLIAPGAANAAFVVPPAPTPPPSGAAAPPDSLIVLGSLDQAYPDRVLEGVERTPDSRGLAIQVTEGMLNSAQQGRDLGLPGSPGDAERDAALLRGLLAKLRLQVPSGPGLTDPLPTPRLPLPPGGTGDNDAPGSAPGDSTDENVPGDGDASENGGTPPSDELTPPTSGFTARTSSFTTQPVVNAVALPGPPTPGGPPPEYPLKGSPTNDNRSWAFTIGIEAVPCSASGCGQAVDRVTVRFTIDPGREFDRFNYTANYSPNRGGFRNVYATVSSYCKEATAPTLTLCAGPVDTPRPGEPRTGQGAGSQTLGHYPLPGGRVVNAARVQGTYILGGTKSDFGKTGEALCLPATTSPGCIY